MKLYLIRHGQSKANEMDVFLGHGDLDLTDKGRAQAELAAKYLSTLNVGAIYSSDLLRAYNTAKATSKLLNIPIIKEKKLREIDCGEWDFMPFDQIKVKYKESFDVWMTDMSRARCDGGESVQELLERMIKVVTKIAQENANKNVLIFTHATSIKSFAGYCLNKGLSGMNEVPWAGNASTTEIEYKDGKFKLIDYGKNDYLGQISTVLPNNI